MSVRDAQEIRDFVNNRGIEQVIHWTKIENLESIRRFGLLTREELERRGIEFKSSDALRLDGRGSINCSISFPNYRMFYAKRGGEQDWIVICLKPDVLWEKRCEFCKTNSASAEIFKASRDKLMGIDALKILFDEEYGDIKRADLQIPDNYTTDPQAEVRVLEQIEAAYISGVYTRGEDGRFFAPRSDWKLWQR